MTSEQRDLVGQLPPLLHGDDGEGATAACFPVDGDVFGIDLEGIIASVREGVTGDHERSSIVSGRVLP